MQLRLTILAAAACVALFEPAISLSQTSRVNLSIDAFVNDARTLQATNPTYLAQFPSPERIKADVSGVDAMQTAAKHASIFWQLRQLVYDLALSQRRTDRQFTPDEQRLEVEYRNARYRAVQPFGEPDYRNPKWFEVYTKYQNDLWLRDEVFKKYFTPELRRQVYVALKAQIPTQNAPEDSRLTPPAGSVTAGNSAGTPGSTSPVVRPRPPDYLEQGDKYFEEKDYQRAIEAYKQALALKPVTEEIAYLNTGIGVCLMQLQRHAEAVAYFMESDRLQPNDPTIILNLGQAYFGSRKLAAAATVFKKAINLKPEMAEAHYGLGGVYVVLGMKNDALEVLRKLMKLDPQMAQWLREQINKMK